MFYGKSNPIESIKQHTNKLLKNLEILRNLYGDKITNKISMNADRFWLLMQIICLYHDTGKVFTAFQNVIRDKLNMKPLPTRFKYDEIKHEQISPAFIPNKQYDLTMEERKLVYQSIYYHHERPIEHINRDLLKYIIDEDIKPNLEEIKKELGIEVGELSTFYLGLVEGQARIKEGDELYNDYCIMKGLLHRVDHCSSADIAVEDDTSEKVSDFVEKRFNKLNDMQNFCKENSDSNLVVIGSTGIGKTEAALAWSKNDKTFFTLPLRISINAIYDRIQNNLRYSHIGLLHSTALDYLEGKREDEDRENSQLLKIEQSRNLYTKITTCTIDQIFTFVFKYKGYEKMYSTLSYSKIVIDEIQAYSPEIVAIILRGLKMINDLGGKFMIMTATLPRIYKEELEKMGVNFKYAEFLKPTKRHRINLLNKEITEDINEIFSKSKNNKTLVIVNTINRAIELYNYLKNSGIKNVNLLHSRFILKDRNDKETAIKEFSANINECGIWITTQIIEASLDIDFDYLYTEMSTLDSLFQRLGRCYRSREYFGEEANVKIYTKNITGIKCVYDEEIHKKSIELLKEYDNQLLGEKEKVDLVDNLYAKETLEYTDFYKRFKAGMKYLDNIIDYEVNKKEAQKLLRNIDNINVIPKIIYDDNLQLFEEYEKEQNLKLKNEMRRKINKLLISINKASVNILGNLITPCPYAEDIMIIDTKYNKEIGLLLEKDDEYEISTREL